LAPYTRESQLPHGKKDPVFRSKPQIAFALVERAPAPGIAIKSIFPDCFYGDHRELVAALQQRRLPFVLSNRGTVDAAGRLRMLRTHTTKSLANCIYATGTR
jgi:SRSO17 transposase